MSAEVVDSNPYSRLMALQRMGIVKDYERIRDKTVRRHVTVNACVSLHDAILTWFRMPCHMTESC